MQLEWMHIPFRKGFLCENLCYFSTSVCTKIDTKHGIAFFYGLKIFGENRFEKFIRLARIISFGYGF